MREGFQEYFQKVLVSSLQKTPEEMLDEYLRICMELAGASGGSILGEQGPHLQFLFSNVPALIGMKVPWDSLAGATARRGVVIYTFAPADKRHFAGVEQKIAVKTKYLLSVPIASVHSTTAAGDRVKCAGVLQLLFEENILPELDVARQASEFSIDTLKEQHCYEAILQEVFWLLPNIAFGMEVMRLRQTSYQVIHELKNKFIAAHSWLNCLRDDLGDIDAQVLTNDSVKEDMELAEGAAREGANLAKGYLQFTKLYSPQFRESDVGKLLSETAANIRVFAAENGAPTMAVTSVADAAVPARNMDPDQMKMALFNLGKNAAEALIEHKVTEPQIRLGAKLVDSKTLHLTIEDNGPGMPSEIASRLFTAFATKKEGGTGLGLTITKKIVDIHGGTIRCDTGSTGTRFTIEM